MAEFIEVLSENAKKDLDGFVAQIKQGVKAVNEINAAFKNTKVPSQANKQIKTATQRTQKLNEMQKEATRIARALERQKAKLAQAEGKQAVELQKVRFETAEANKRAKEAAILSSRLSSEYQKQQVQLSRLIKEQRDLAIRQELGNKLSKKEEEQLKRLTREIQRKDAALKRADAGVGKFQRNVGNYTSALNGATSAARGLASALGLMGGAFLIVQVFRDAFNRIREFDKSMQNLSGILGVSRKDLKGLETTIISVAGASIKTSNEVADLATALITLGKTESEVKMLLKPVNDLSIALQASSEDAGQLLVGTLNAFQKSAAEGERYANVIAKVRTSTALDFEQIKDGFGFISASANAAGLSIEETAAMIGILADNNIRGQRAGRLMSTSMLRLAADGKSLEQALSELSKVQRNAANEQEVLAFSAELFGKEAAPLALILANNTKRFADLTKELENSQGALDELTEQQLKSVDAQLKILDSTWEKFILSVENGEGVLSNVFSGFLKGINAVLQASTLLAQSVNEIADEKTQQRLNKLSSTFQNFDRNSKEQRLILRESIIQIREEIEKAENKSLAFTYALGAGGKAIRNEAEANVKSLNDVLAAFLKLQSGANPEEIFGGGSEANKTEEIQVKTIKFYEDLISKLKQLQKEVPEDDPLKFQELQTDIDNAEQSLLKLMRLFKGFEDQESVNFLGETDLTTITNQMDVVGQILEDNQNKVKEFTDAVKGDLQGAFGEIGRMYQLDMSRWDALFDDKKNTVKDFAIAFADLLGAAMHQVTQMEVARIDQQIEANRRYYENQIQLAEGNENQQEIIRQQSAAKERELLRKKAQAEKKQAVFETIISTAVAVAKALPNIPLSILVGALGAAKTALISSTPLPQYKKGRKGGKEEYAILGDGGKNEPIIGRDGKLKAISPDTSTIMHLDQGDKVLPSLDHLTNSDVNNAAIMASLASQKQDYNAENTAKMFESLLRKQQKETIKALKGAKFVNHNFNQVDLNRSLKKLKYR